MPLLYSTFFLGITAFVVHVLLNLGYHLTYSVTNSVPKGFYFIVPRAKLVRHDLVQFIPPAKTLEFLLNKHWLPQSGLMLKYVVGMPGDLVCNKDNFIWVNQKKLGRIFAFYAPAKKLPQINYCGKLGSDQYLLLSTNIERSFDGRYFGPISRGHILGKALPLKDN